MHLHACLEQANQELGTCRAVVAASCFVALAKAMELLALGSVQLAAQRLEVLAAVAAEAFQHKPMHLHACLELENQELGTCHHTVVAASCRVVPAQPSKALASKAMDSLALGFA